MKRNFNVRSYSNNKINPNNCKHEIVCKNILHDTNPYNGQDMYRCLICDEILFFHVCENLTASDKKVVISCFGPLEHSEIMIMKSILNYICKRCQIMGIEKVDIIKIFKDVCTNSEQVYDGIATELLKEKITKIN